MYTWKSFFENVIEGCVVKGTTLIFSGVPAIQIPAEILTREGIKQVFSWLEKGIDNQVIEYLDSWISDNKKHLVSSSEMITQNVIDCIHYLMDQKADKNSAIELLQINSLAQKGFLKIKRNSQFSEREKSEIQLALNYIIEKLVKTLAEKRVPQAMWEIMQSIEDSNDQMKKYSDSLLSLTKHVNDFEYYIQHLEYQFSFIFDKLSQPQETSPVISFNYIMGLISPIQTTGFSKLHYMNNAMNDFLFGRNDEKKELNNFLLSDIKFSFLVVAGPGGIGKSKLVYSFYLDILKSGKDWKCAFINTTILEKLAYCSNWNMEKDCLLIYDYAGSSPDLLHKCFANIALSEEKLNYKIRVILIERTGTKEESIRSMPSYTEEKVVTFPYWYNTIVTRQSREYYPDDFLTKYLFKFLNLKELRLKDYMELANTYSSQVYNRSLSFEEKTLIREFAKAQPSKNSRPLFLLAVTDVVINGKNAARWNTEGIVQEICLRDDRIFREK